MKINQNAHNTAILLNTFTNNYFLVEKTWFPIAGAAKASGGEAVYHIFEQRSLVGKYKDKNQIRRAWDNATAFSFGTLIKFALDEGVNLNALPFDNSGNYTPPPVHTRLQPKPELTSSDTFQAVVKNYLGCDECDLYERSPFKLEWNYENECYKDADTVLQYCFKPDEFIFVGKNDTGNSGVQSVKKWRETISKNKRVPNSHIIANPLSGKAFEIIVNGKPKMTKRSNANVSAFRFAVLEMDERPLSEQVAFWVYAIEHRWPIALIVYSGGKSIHGWLSINCKSSEQWETEIKDTFKRVLVPLGFDPATATIARLSRLAGFFRREKQQFQKLLYLNPDVINWEVA